MLFFFVLFSLKLHSDGFPRSLATKTNRLQSFVVFVYIFSASMVEIHGCQQPKIRTFRLISVCVKINAVIQPYCEFEGKQYNCGLSLACTLAGGVTKDLCNGGPLWQCCLPKSVTVAAAAASPTFSLNDASKFSLLPFTSDFITTIYQPNNDCLFNDMST